MSYQNREQIENVSSFTSSGHHIEEKVCLQGIVLCYQVHEVVFSSFVQSLYCADEQRVREEKTS